MFRITILATSLRDNSNSQKLAQIFEELAQSQSIETQLIDLRELNLPLAGTPGCWEEQTIRKLKEAIDSASHIVFAVPIYCYDVNAAAKNIIELVGRSFTQKVVGFICAAGGSNSYMSVMGMANHLMLDFRSVIVPRFVYTDYTSWEETGDLKTDIKDRLECLLTDLKQIQIINPSSSSKLNNS